ncbi:MAG: hypothetical protein HRF43_10960 [Phycisphaerae bacterium]|jgi:hypothetical protein
MNGRRPPILVVLKTSFLAQPRKSAVLLVLFVVMVVVYIRMFSKDGTPAAAQAAPPPIIAAPAGAGASDVWPAVQRFQPMRPLVRNLERDPFKLLLDRFAVDPDAAAAERTPTPDAPTARPKPPEPELVLQGTLCGADKLAWINGRCVQEGDEIDGYRVEQVEPTRVTLTRDDVQRVLTME